MSTTRNGWIGWWIVTVALVALIATAIGCKRQEGSKDEAPDTPPGVELPVPPPLGPQRPTVNRPGSQHPRPVEPPPTTSPGAGETPRPGGPRSTDPADVLRQLQWAQKQFRVAGNVDEDFDSRGEYGGLSELSRASGGRMGRPIATALIPTELGQLNQRGEGRLGDYLYRMWLPGLYGMGVGELWGGAGAAQFEPNLVEDYWVCYAWPASGTGPTYFTSQDGRVLMTDDARYSGSGRGPRAGAALLRGDIADMLAAPAANANGLDGNMWRTAP